MSCFQTVVFTDIDGANAANEVKSNSMYIKGFGNVSLIAKDQVIFYGVE